MFSVAYSRKVKLGGKDCEHEGGSICNGAVTEVLGDYLRTCTNGRLIRRRASKVGKGYALVGRDTGPGKGLEIKEKEENMSNETFSDCDWYGTTFCDGDVMEVEHLL